MFRRLYSQSARDILRKGFERMNKDRSYRKNEKDLQQLVTAGKELGAPPDIVRQAYDAVLPGKVPQDDIERTRIDDKVVKALDIPSPQDFGPEFQWDDLPSAGHLQLEEHRGQRHYTRIAAYELPQLIQYRSEYRRPNKSQLPLKFKHFAVVGEDHPSNKKVVLSFKPESSGLKGKELHKLKLVAGRRYNMSKNLITLASARFPEQAQNKRFLGDLYSRLIQAAKDTSDDFADIPLNPDSSMKTEKRRFRLYPEHKFPSEWNRPDLAPKPKEDLINALSR